MCKYSHVFTFDTQSEIGGCINALQLAHFQQLGDPTKSVQTVESLLCKTIPECLSNREILEA